MDKMLQEQLFNKYPKIFVQRTLPMTETAMCWGLECGDGWYKLLDYLCASLQWDTDHNKYPQVVATQVKEKFGTLRFYYTTESGAVLDEAQHLKWAHQEGKINFAEMLSETICERCGAIEGVTQTKGWVVTLCPTCMRAYKKEQGVGVWGLVGWIERLCTRIISIGSCHKKI